MATVSDNLETRVRLEGAETYSRAMGKITGAVNRAAEAQRAFQQRTAAWQQLGTQMGAMGTKMMMAGAAVAAGLGMATGAALKQEQAEERLRKIYGGNVDAIIAYAKSLQQLTRYGDEAIIEAAAFGATFPKLRDYMEEAMRAAVNMAEAYGMDLTGAMRLVGKASAGYTSELGRYGIVIDKTVLKQKGWLAVFDTINSETQNAAFTVDDASKSLDQMKNALGDTAEQVGKVLLPEVVEIASKLKEWSEQFDALPEKTKQSLVEMAKFGAIALILGGLSLKMASVVVQAGLLVGQLKELAVIAPMLTSIGGAIAIPAAAGLGVYLMHQRMVASEEEAAEENARRLAEMEAAAKTRIVTSMVTGEPIDMEKVLAYEPDKNLQRIAAQLREEYETGSQGYVRSILQAARQEEVPGGTPWGGSVQVLGDYGIMGEIKAQQRGEETYQFLLSRLPRTYEKNVEAIRELRLERRTATIEELDNNIKVLEARQKASKSDAIDAHLIELRKEAIERLRQQYADMNEEQKKGKKGTDVLVAAWGEYAKILDVAKDKQKELQKAEKERHQEQQKQLQERMGLMSARAGAYRAYADLLEAQGVKGLRLRRAKQTAAWVYQQEAGGIYGLMGQVPRGGQQWWQMMGGALGAQTQAANITNVKIDLKQKSPWAIQAEVNQFGGQSRAQSFHGGGVAYVGATGS